MGFRLLFDEMTERNLATYCTKLGHDVERVVTVPELGPGSDDAEVLAYAERDDRILITYDDDFLSEHEAHARIGILFGPDDRVSPLETANVIDAIRDHLNQQQIVSYDAPLHLSRAWLSE